jgi:hypothetical protein
LGSYGNAFWTRRVPPWKRGVRKGAADAAAKEMTMSQEQKAEVLARAAALLGRTDDRCRQVLGQLWDVAFEDGRLDALDEFQDRFCVCMK